MLNDLQAFQSEEHQPFLLQGGTPAAVLVHGFPGTPAEMRPLGQALHDLGWTVHAPLLPGFGAQINKLGEHGNADWVAAVENALRALRQDHSPLLLIGFSLGGALALQTAAKSPPDALALLAPFWQAENIVWALTPILTRIFPTLRPVQLMKRLKMNPNDPEVRKGMADFFPPDTDFDDPRTQQTLAEFAIPTRIFRELHHAGQMGYRAARKVRVPTLVVQGRQDTLVTPALTRKLIAQIGGQVRYHEVDAEHALGDSQGAVWEHVKQVVCMFAASKVQGVAV